MILISNTKALAIILSFFTQGVNTKVMMVDWK